VTQPDPAVEVVALALADKASRGHVFRDRYPFSTYDDDARAVLAALREAGWRPPAEVERLRAELAEAAALWAPDRSWAALAAERDALVNLRDAARGLEVVLGAAAGRVNLADIEHQLSALLAALPPREDGTEG
jgi:hypothetical protein